MRSSITTRIGETLVGRRDTRSSDTFSIEEGGLGFSERYQRDSTKKEVVNYTKFITENSEETVGFSSKIKEDRMKLRNQLIAYVNNNFIDIFLLKNWSLWGLKAIVELIKTGDSYSMSDIEAWQVRAKQISFEGVHTSSMCQETKYVGYEDSSSSTVSASASSSDSASGWSGSYRGSESVRDIKIAHNVTECEAPTDFRIHIGTKDSSQSLTFSDLDKQIDSWTRIAVAQSIKDAIENQREYDWGSPYLRKQ